MNFTFLPNLMCNEAPPPPPKMIQQTVGKRVRKWALLLTCKVIKLGRGQNKIKAKVFSDSQTERRVLSPPVLSAFWASNPVSWA